MKTIIRSAVLFFLGVCAAAGARAMIESVKIEPTYVPQFSPALLLRGITEGQVVLVVDISADGRLTDWLALGSTDPLMVPACVEALKGWAITPARVDGQPVAAQVQLTVTMRADGVVLSRTADEVVGDFIGRITGPRLKYDLSPARALDRAPAPLAMAGPQYAAAAAQQGVHGKVEVHFYIDPTGAVRLPAVEAGAHPYLAETAVAAVREWKFSPPTRRGRPVLVAASQVFNFNDAK